VHDLEVGGADNQAPSNEVNELYPGVADEQEARGPCRHPSR
jgi:hypothetical protein